MPDVSERAVAKVRELHIGIYTRTLDEDGNPEEYCEACSTSYPCPTVVALGEEL